MENRPLLLAPSLLACDFWRIGEKIKILETAGVGWLHLDVMDGDFVPNISFGQPLIKSIRKNTGLFFDVHLMIRDPARYIASFAEAGADLICIHAESALDPSAVLDAIRGLGKKAGVAIKPATPVAEIVPLLRFCDLALVMSVEPGFGGQAFMPSALDKLKALRRLREEKGLDFLIEVDGGVGPDNARAAREAGADVLVAGSSVLGAEDAGKAVEEIRAAAVNLTSEKEKGKRKNEVEFLRNSSVFKGQ